jgi:hypothetical protein
MLSGWLAPQEVKQARALLQQGNPRAAAQVLLKASAPADHRDMVKARQEVAQALVAEARQAFAGQAWASACEALDLAAQLAPLGAEAQVLREEIRRAAEAALEKYLAQAREALQQGDLETARRCWQQAAQRYSQDTRVQELDRVLKEQEQQRIQEAALKRALERGWEALKQGDLEAARRCWQEATRHQPLDARVRELTQALAQAERESAAGGGQRAIRQRSQCWRLNDWLVLSLPEVVIGLANGEGVQLPLWGRIHRRHARLLRDGRRYRLVPCLDKQGQACLVQCNGRPVPLAGCVLQTGDVLVFGGGPGRWRFQQATGSGTATLCCDQEEVTGITRAPGYRQVLLLDEEACLAGQPAPQVQGVLAGLPGELRLRWTTEGLRWEVRGAEVIEGTPEGAEVVEGTPEGIEAVHEGWVYVPMTRRLRAKVENDIDFLQVLVMGQPPKTFLLRFDPA